jgi:2-keto-3-deoxy-6-phosphogluconate aldolase
MNALRRTFAEVSLKDKEKSMRLIQSLAVILLLGLAACAGTGTVVPQEQAAQYAQAGSPFPYNSFYCP